MDSAEPRSDFRKNSSESAVHPSMRMPGLLIGKKALRSASGLLPSSFQTLSQTLYLSLSSRPVPCSDALLSRGADGPWSRTTADRGPAVWRALGS